MSTPLAIRTHRLDDRADQEDFLALTPALRGRDPRAVTPIWHHERAALDLTLHPGLPPQRRGYVAWRGAQPMARLLASVVEGSGQFGWFESAAGSGEGEAVAAVLQAAMGWLRDQGCTRLRGPIDRTPCHPCGLQLSGHDAASPYGLPHHPPRYQTLLRRHGLYAAQGWWSWAWPLDEPTPRRARAAERWEAAGQAAGLTVDAVTGALEDHLPAWHAVHARRVGCAHSQAAFSDLVYDQLRHSPSALTLEVRSGGAVCGFAFCEPDLGPVLPASGRLSPWGWWQLGRAVDHLSRARVALWCVDPTAAAPAAPLLLLALARRARELGLRQLDVPTPAEGVVDLHGALRQLGARVDRRYAVLEGVLPPRRAAEDAENSPPVGSRSQP